jgi:MFS family permease
MAFHALIECNPCVFRHVMPAPIVEGMNTTNRSLAALSLLTLLPSLGTSIANVALPTLAQSFGKPFDRVQWVVIAYLVAATALVVIAGRLGDRHGHRRVMLAGITLFLLASAACALSPTLEVLVAARVVQGMGAAVMLSLSMAFVAQVVPKERTGGAMGLLGSMSAIGTALGPSLGGALVAAGGWRWIFVAQVPLAALALILARRDLPERKSSAAPAPLFATPDAALGRALAMTALISTVLMATLIVGPFHLSRAIGLETALVGAAMSVGPFVAAASGVPAGRIVDRFGPAKATATGLFALAVGSLALSLAPRSLGVLGYIAPLAIMTAGYALFQAANNTSVMANVAAHRRGVVSGTLNLARNLGLIAGASAMGAIFSAATAPVDAAVAPPETIASATRTTFGVATLLVLLALLLALEARRLPAPATHRPGAPAP